MTLDRVYGSEASRYEGIDVLEFSVIFISQGIADSSCDTSPPRGWQPQRLEAIFMSISERGSSSAPSL